MLSFEVVKNIIMKNSNFINAEPFVESLDELKTAKTMGGVLFRSSVFIYIYNCNFTNNKANAGSGTIYTIYKFIGRERGGGISILLIFKLFIIAIGGFNLASITVENS